MKKFPCNGHDSAVCCFHWGPLLIEKIRVLERGFSARLIPEPPPTQIAHKNGVIYPYISSAMDYFGLLIINSIPVLGL